MSSTVLARIACTATVLSVVGVAFLAAPLPRAAAQSAATPDAVLHEGIGLRNEPSVRVRRLQRILDRRGFDLGRPGVDGRFGPLTAAAVRRMQNRYGLVADGVVGPKTRRLVSLLAERRRPQSRDERPQEPAQTPQPAQPQAPAPAPAQTPTRSAPQAPTTSAPQAPATEPAPQAQPAPATAAPTAETQSGSAEGPTWLTIALICAAVLAAAALAGVVARRRSPSGTPAMLPIGRELFVEGHSDHPTVGTFRGIALGAAVSPRASDDPGQTRYLVDDPRKPAPVWVRGSDIRRSPSRLAEGEAVIGYVAADADPTREQRAFMDIEALCEQAGWTLEEIIREREMGRMPDRPGLRRALEIIAAGEARGMIVTDAHSVTDSLADLGALLEWFRDAEAAFIALDLDLDTTTPSGHRTATTVMSVAAWETERGHPRAGLARVETRERTGRLNTEERARLAERIAAMRNAGMTLQAIADQLNGEGVPTPRGSTWRPSTVSTVLGTPRTLRSVRSELPPLNREERR
jgi:DNA invertase Pin-like site-specific DNA recombinase/peptidoglycan hydrolase-like protein with peptidoglycan-binding domain